MAEPKNVEKHDAYYDAKVSIRSMMTIIPNLKKRLQCRSKRLKLFMDSCFGHWLDVPYTDNEPRLVHAMLQRQRYADNNHNEDQPLVYEVYDSVLHFGRREFCLTTGLVFDELSWASVQGLPIPIRGRLFEDVVGDNITYKHFLKVLNGERWLYISDEDAVRVCLVLFLGLVLPGNEPVHKVNIDELRLVEDLDRWNMFPWGAVVWPVLYVNIKNVIFFHRLKHMKKKYLPTYSLNGFVWAFKIWILESFKLATSWWSKNHNIIPRGISWKTVTMFEKTHHQEFFFENKDNDMMLLNIELQETVAEERADWWISSRHNIQCLPPLHHKSKKRRVTPRSVDTVRVPPVPLVKRDLPPVPPCASDTIVPRSEATNNGSTLEDRVSAKPTEISELKTCFSSEAPCEADTTMPRSEATSSHLTLEDRVLAIEKTLTIEISELKKRLYVLEAPREADTTMPMFEATSKPLTLEERVLAIEQTLTTEIPELKKRVSTLEITPRVLPMNIPVSAQVKPKSGLLSRPASPQEPSRPPKTHSVFSENEMVPDGDKKDGGSTTCAPDCSVAGNKPFSFLDSQYGVATNASMAHANDHASLTDEKMQKIVNELLNAGISESDVGMAAEVCYKDPIKLKVLFALPVHLIRSYVSGFLFLRN